MSSRRLTVFEYPFGSYLLGKAQVPPAFFGQSFPSTILILHMIGFPPSLSAIK
jgi:hypothetical protein